MIHQKKQGDSTYKLFLKYFFCIIGGCNFWNHTLCEKSWSLHTLHGSLYFGKKYQKVDFEILNSEKFYDLFYQLEDLRAIEIVLKSAK